MNLHFEPNSILVVGGILSLIMGMMLLAQTVYLKAYRVPLGAMTFCLFFGAASIFSAVSEPGLKVIEIKLAANLFGSFAYLSAMACFLALYKPQATRKAVIFMIVFLLMGAPFFTDLKSSYIFNQSVRIAAVTYATYLMFISSDRAAPKLRWFSLAITGFSAVGMIPQLLIVLSQSTDEVMHLITQGQNASLYQSMMWAVSPSLTYTCVTSVVYTRISAQLQHYAYFDILTGTNNRRFLIEKGTKVIEERRAHLPDGATSLLMIDVDHFKRINDDWGHTVGDSVLAHCAACIQSVIREDDAIIARYGGEEFCVVLPQTSISAANIVAERVRAHIAETPYVHSEGRIPITISVGVALQEQTSTFNNLVSLADSRLYQAKKSGRNRVIDQCEESALSA